MIINNEILSNMILRVEEQLTDLTINEKLYLLEALKNRQLDLIQKQKMADAVGNVPLGGLMKRALGMTKKHDEDE